MKRLFKLVTFLAVVASIVWGILWLEDMRKQSAQEARDHTEAVMSSSGDE